MKDIVKQAQPIIILLAICGVIVAGISWFMSGTSSSNSVELVETNDEIPGPIPAEEIKAYNVDITNKSNPIAVLETNKGTIEIELFQDWMPITAGNFIKLAEEGFYDGIKFHRVIDGFMIQGGDPITKTDEVLRYGTGGPGYTIPDEFIDADLLTNIRGTIAMANSGPESGGSQFFINLADNRHLDFNIPDPNNSSHPVFGHVVKGMNVVDEIGKASTTPMNLPLEDITIENVTIRK